MRIRSTNHLDNYSVGNRIKNTLWMIKTWYGFILTNTLGA